MPLVESRLPTRRSVEGIGGEEPVGYVELAR